MSRAASPFVKAGFILAVLVVSGARVRGVDFPSCSQEVTRCLAACRAVVSRRFAEETRDAHMMRDGQRSVATNSRK